MSVRTMAKVWEESSHSGSELLMLLALGDFADDDGEAYPSITTLAAKCRTTNRYAIKLLDALVASGELQIVKHGGVAGRGGTTNRYRIMLGQLGQKSAQAVHSSSVVNPSSVVNSGAGSSEPGDNKVVHQSSPKPSVTISEPPINKVLSIPGIPDQLLVDYMAVRKAKKGGPLTATAIAGLQREADLAGITLSQAVTVCCENGWRGFKATWYANQSGGQVSEGRRTRQLETAALMTGAKPAARPIARLQDFTDINYREGIDAHGHITS